ncbi:MAG: VacJ family lipoprotein [Candidatus Berkiella sp.]
MLRRTLVSALLGIVSLTMTGCATQKNPHVDDPFEGLNRATFGFNKAVDTVVVKPVSYVYLKYIPQPVQIGVGNFFDNIREVTNIANDVLQLKFKYAAHDLSRLLINTTLGIGGLFDPASSLGLEHRKEDFGQTLYHWGYHHSYYIVLPFIGPSTFRDTLGLGVDYYGLSIWPWIENDWKKYALLGLDYLDLRARLLRRESVLDVLAVDEYTFMRDAYFQHRKYLFEESVTTLNDDIYEGYSPEDIPSSSTAASENNTSSDASLSNSDTGDNSSSNNSNESTAGENLSADNTSLNAQATLSDTKQNAVKKVSTSEKKSVASKKAIDKTHKTQQKLTVR